MQQTDEATIQQEKELVRKLAGLDRVAQIEFNDLGWTSRVYIVGSGQIVFKFPRYESIKKEYAREVSAYKIAQEIAQEFAQDIAQDCGSVLIPNVRWQHPTFKYLGYQGIVGQHGEEAIPRLSPPERHSIGRQLGRFLKEFHQRHLPDAPLMSPDKEFADFRKRLDQAKPHLQRFFTDQEVSKISHIMGVEYPQRMMELGFTKGLCHGDLGYWNLIYCPGRRDDQTDPGGQIGIIDFGDTAYYDTAIDFAGMSDPEMLDAALDAYGSHVSREKIALRRNCLPLFDLHFFAGKNDPVGIKKTIQRIRKTVLDQH